MRPAENHHQNLVTFPTPEELNANLADTISGLLQDAIEERNRAVLVVSGGSTPKPLFKLLANKNIAWDRVTITLADDRWVDVNDPTSNELLVRTCLLQDKAKNAHFVGLKNSSPTARTGEKNCRQHLDRLPKPFDVVILGMGNDGHTASLFPNSPGLEQALDSSGRSHCLAMTAPSPPVDRMTLTVPFLLDARQIFLHIVGEEKKNVLRQALAEGPAVEMPIRSFLRQYQTPLKIYWAP